MILKRPASIILNVSTEVNISVMWHCSIIERHIVCDIDNNGGPLL